MTEVFTWPVGRDAESESGGRRRGIPLRFVLVHVACSAAGGALTGFALAAAGSWVRGRGTGPTWLLLVLAGCLVLVAIAFELQGRISPLPQRHAQVPRRWLAWRRLSVTAGAFGFMIGSGALTYLQHASAYALVALLVLMPSGAEGAMVGGIYGLTRGLSALASWSAARFAGKEIRWERLLEARELVARGLAATSALALVAVVVAELASEQIL